MWWDDVRMEATSSSADQWTAMYAGDGGEWVRADSPRNSIREYVVETALTNAIEDLGGHFKLTHGASCRKVSHKSPQSYLYEFAFRYNGRDAERAILKTLPLLRTSE